MRARECIRERERERERERDGGGGGGSRQTDWQSNRDDYTHTLVKEISHHAAHSMPQMLRNPNVSKSSSGLVGKREGGW